MTYAHANAHAAPAMEDRTHAEEPRFPFAAAPGIGQLQEVVPGLLWLRLPLPYRLDHVNIYLLAEGDAWAAIDTGLGNTATKAIWEAVLRDRLAGAGLSRLIVTHFHPDHVGLAGWLTRTGGMTLHMPATEYEQSAALQRDGVDSQAPIFRDFYRRSGLPGPAIERQLAGGHDYLRRTTGLPASFVPLRAGDDLAIGPRRWRVLTGGGHSPEQGMLYCAAERLFLSADQVIATISPNVSVMPTLATANPLGDYLDSLHALIRDVPDDVLVLPGHGLPFYGLHARARDLIAHHRSRCALILEAVTAAPLSPAELIPIVFRDKTLDDHQTGFALGEVLAHVNHMVARGDLRRAPAAGAVDRYLPA